jgi:hypothetical protein
MANEKKCIFRLKFNIKNVTLSIFLRNKNYIY